MGNKILTLPSETGAETGPEKGVLTAADVQEMKLLIRNTTVYYTYLENSVFRMQKQLADLSEALARLEDRMSAVETSLANSYPSRSELESEFNKIYEILSV
ncbi:MAG: hypothetical protein E6Q06_04150 [Candidatus Moraniibacteriota bacterium]|nr:MAG: hypothetical protein E6Q06_04150 [Candidatus Moranbacteria bacterium]